MITVQLRQRCIGFMALGLLEEVNTAFLNSRRLLLLAGMEGTTLYKVNLFLLFTTYVTFRIGTIIAGTIWCTLSYTRFQSLIDWTIILIGIVFSNVFNWILLYMLVAKEISFLKKRNNLKST